MKFASIFFILFFSATAMVSTLTFADYIPPVTGVCCIPLPGHPCPADVPKCP